MRFLVPIDFSPKSGAAMATASVLARPGDEIELLHVLPTVDSALTLLANPISSAAVANRLELEARERLTQFAADASIPSGIEVRLTISFGDPAVAIVDIAQRDQANLIVMGTAAHGPVGRALVGSTADEVARSSTVPALLLRAGKAPVRGTPIARVYVPLDGSRRSLGAVPVASELARHINVPVHLVRVREIERSALSSGPQITPDVMNELMASEAREIAIALEEIADGIRRSGLTATWSMLTGPVATSLENDVEAADLLVLSSHGRSGIRRLLTGSVAEHLVRNSPTPIVLVPALVPTGAITAR
jgi:nucleotide-binding universal stress UspA family protein